MRRHVHELRSWQNGGGRTRAGPFPRLPPNHYRRRRDAAKEEGEKVFARDKPGVNSGAPCGQAGALLHAMGRSWAGGLVARYRKLDMRRGAWVRMGRRSTSMGQ